MHPDALPAYPASVPAQLIAGFRRHDCVQEFTQCPAWPRMAGIDPAPGRTEPLYPLAYLFWIFKLRGNALDVAEG